MRPRKFPFVARGVSFPGEPTSEPDSEPISVEGMEKEDMRQALEETLASLAEMLCKICVERVTWCRLLAEDEQEKAGAEEIWKQYVVKRGDWIKPLGIAFTFFTYISYVWTV